MKGLAEPTRMTAFDEDTAVGIVDGVEGLEDYLTTAEAHQLAESMGHILSIQAIAAAARRGAGGADTGISGAVQIGGERKPWIFPRESFLNWLRNRRPRGPKPER